MIWLLSCIRSQGPLISNPQFSQSRECDQFVQFSEEQVSHIWSLQSTQSIGVEEKNVNLFSTTLIFFTNGKYYFHVENEEPWKGSCFLDISNIVLSPIGGNIDSNRMFTPHNNSWDAFYSGYGIELLVGNTSQTLRYSPNYNPDVHQPYFVQPQKRNASLNGQSPSEVLEASSGRDGIQEDPNGQTGLPGELLGQSGGSGGNGYRGTEGKNASHREVAEFNGSVWKLKSHRETFSSFVSHDV